MKEEEEKTYELVFNTYYVITIIKQNFYFSFDNGKRQVYFLTDEEQLKPIGLMTKKGKTE